MIFDKSDEPARLEPTQKNTGLKYKAQEFWVTNNLAIGILIVSISILIVLIMMSYAAATGHIHFLSTEANNYEHLTEIVVYTGGVIHG